MSDSETLVARDYRDTVFLPETDFPMRAGLPQAEPRLLERWQAADLYHLVRTSRRAAGAPLFVLHDGPPYANGNIHIGHALNKILKDFVVRSRFALGFDVDYVPGWDCHGLPIEWKIEERYRAKGQRKDDVPVAEFRRECRAYAAEWIGVQGADFKRLGILGDWANRYATMDFASEAAIVAEFHRFVASGQLYRGSKPVMWSPVERTALADAEVEYHDHNSPTVWVKFPVVEGSNAASGASVVIWTTTPWTIPANRAVSYNPDIAYAAYQVEAVFLFNFTQFIEWPAASFPAPATPFVIGVLGQNPFGGALEEAVRGEVANGRPFVIRYFRRVEDIDTCHILFISRSETNRLRSIFSQLQGRNILTVGDANQFAERGGVVCFVVRNQRVGLKINLSAAREAQLTISSKLLRPAEIINAEDR